jgi:hypothetical protein
LEEEEMKRINLSVDLGDNEILEKSIKEAIVAQGKQIAREEFTKVLESEIERVVDAKITNLKNAGYFNETIKRITELVVQRLDNEIKVGTAEVNTIIENKVNSYLDAKIKNKNGLDEFVQQYIDKSIANAFISRANNSK